MDSTFPSPEDRAAAAELALVWVKTRPESADSLEDLVNAYREAKGRVLDLMAKSRLPEFTRIEPN